MSLKKKSSKSKKSGRSKPIVMKFDNGSWSTDALTKEAAEKLISEVVAVSEGRPPYPQFVPIEQVRNDNVRTITVVARSIKNQRGLSIQLSDGRMAAQAGHAVSRLKLGYVIQSSQKDIATAYGNVIRVYDTPLTSIVLEARDQAELHHIMELCLSKSLYTVQFHDENVEEYGAGQFLTAISIGPVTPDMVYGVTNYLPLFNSYA